MPIKPSQADLDEIERVTLEHYESNAESFWLGTRDHDVSQKIEAFLCIGRINGLLYVDCLTDSGS